MSDRDLAHDITDVVALYALGALSQHEARAFEEHLAEGCDVCEAELPSFEQTASAIGFSVSEVKPSAEVRDRLMMRLNNLEKPTRLDHSSEFISILAAEGEWQELQAGIMMKQLYVDHASGLATSLVKMPPGTALPAHAHAGVEQLFIIEGDCNVRGQRLGPGDYHRAEAGSIHETTYTVEGTTFLLVAPEEYDVLNAG